MATPIAILQSALTVAPKVLALGESLFKGDGAWAEYEVEVKKLTRTLETYEKFIGDLDFGTYSLVEPVLKDARDELERDHKYFLKMDKSADRCCSSSFTAWFTGPSDLKQRTEILKSLPDEIKRVLADGKVFREAGESSQKGSFAIKSDTPVPDGRFVHLENYEAQIYAALKDVGPGAPCVVFLHGGQGIGKTMMALHVAADIGKTLGNQEAPSALPSVFGCVFFITCGTSVRSDEVEMELKRRLGLKPRAESREISDALQKTKILVILDDVHDIDIPAKAIEFGGRSQNGSKFFITSSNQALCSRCASSMIHDVYLKTISRDQARRILSSHSNLRFGQGKDPNYPKGVLRIMDEVIDETEGNPLALACFASSIRQERVRDVAEWNEARKVLQSTLSQEIDARVLHRNYPRSFWGMMRKSLHGLGENERTLLLLVSILLRASELETVIQDLYVALDLGDTAAFRTASTHLAERNLITMEGNENADGVITWTWAIQPLRKQFIETEGVGGEITEKVQKDGFMTKTTEMGEFVKGKLTDYRLRALKNNAESDLQFVKFCSAHIQPKFRPSQKLRILSLMVLGGVRFKL